MQSGKFDLTSVVAAATGRALSGYLAWARWHRWPHCMAMSRWHSIINHEDDDFNNAISIQSEGKSLGPVRKWKICEQGPWCCECQTVDSGEHLLRPTGACVKCSLSILFNHFSISPRRTRPLLDTGNYLWEFDCKVGEWLCLCLCLSFAVVRNLSLTPTGIYLGSPNDICQHAAMEWQLNTITFAG